MTELKISFSQIKHLATSKNIKKIQIPPIKKINKKYDT